MINVALMAGNDQMRKRFLLLRLFLLLISAAVPACTAQC